MSELLVKVKTRDAGEIIGVLVETHMVPQQGQPQFAMTPDKKLVQGPQQMQLLLYALVAHPGGFTFGPMSDVVPLFPPDFPGMPQSECPSGCSGEDESCDKCPDTNPPDSQLSEAEAAAFPDMPKEESEDNGSS